MPVSGVHSHSLAQPIIPTSSYHVLWH